MADIVSLDTPLAAALNTAVHSRIVEEGWTQEDDTALAEYIVLMLANGKTQEQVASELAGELLQDASGTEEFSRWLFEQVAALTNGDSGAAGPTAGAADTITMPDQFSTDSMDAVSSIPAAYEADMGDNAPDNAPKGPRGLHGGRPGRGGRGGMSKPSDSALHRTRGNDRIGSHIRGAPKGPRGLNQNVRPGLQKALNGMSGPSPPSPNTMIQNGMPPGPPGQQNPMAFSPEQQMQYLAMMEQQARLMAQWNEWQQGMGGPPPNGMPGGPPGPGGPGGRSLFDRVERGRGGGRGWGRGGFQQNGSTRSPITNTEGEVKTEADDGASAMDPDQFSQFQHPRGDPATTMCNWNLQCTNKTCQYVHQSPAAPLNIQVDMTQTCSFGPACKKPTCVARHPSPALVRAHQAEEQCKFFPKCTKPNCPFKHPNAPLCSFGVSCKNPSCKFTHLDTPCRFNPCTNTKCPYKHVEGQSRTINDYTWTPESAKQKEEQSKEHVSDRKFVDQNAGEEELIKPEGGENGTAPVEANAA